MSACWADQTGWRATWVLNPENCFKSLQLLQCGRKLFSLWHHHNTHLWTINLILSSYLLLQSMWSWTAELLPSNKEKDKNIFGGFTIPKKKWNFQVLVCIYFKYTQYNLFLHYTVVYCLCVYVCLTKYPYPPVVEFRSSDTSYPYMSYFW